MGSISIEGRSGSVSVLVGPELLPALLSRRDVKAAHFGRKIGKSWYVYKEDGTQK
jgi:hypothetical protein